MPTGVNILITAENAQALATLQQTQAGVHKLGQASQQANLQGIQNLQKGTVGLANGLRAMQGTLILLGGQAFPQLTMGALTAQQAMTGLRAVSEATKVSMLALGTAMTARLLGAWKIAEFVQENIGLWQDTAALEKSRQDMMESTAVNMGKAYADAIADLTSGRIKLTDEEIRFMDRLAANATPENLKSFLKLYREKLPEGASKSDAERNRYVSDQLAALEASLKYSDANVAYLHRVVPLEIQRVQIERAYADESKKVQELKAKEYLTDEQAKERMLALDTQRLEKLTALKSAEISAVQSDWRLTDAQKYQRLSGLGVSTNELGPNPNSFRESLGGGAIGMLNQIGTAAQNAASIVTNTLGAAFQTIGDSITGLIMGTLTWGQALAQIGRQILSTLISSIVQFFVNILARALLNAIAGTAIQASAAAAASALWAGPAILASVATFGAAAAQAPASVMAALATAPAIGALGSIAGYVAGGRPELGQLALVGERGPELFVPDTAGTILPANVTEQVARYGGPSGGGRNDRIGVNVFVDRREMLLTLRDDHDAENWIVDIMRRNSYRF